MAVIDYFSKRRSFALGVQAGGLGAGVFATPHLARYLIDNYAWKGAILLFGGFQLHGLILVTLMKPSPKPKPVKVDPENNEMIKNGVNSEKNMEKDSKEKRTCNFSLRTFIDYTILKDPNTCLLFISVALSACSHLMPQLLLPARVMSDGYTKSKATLIVSIMGLSSLFSRPLAGLLGDKFSRHRTLIVAIANIAVGLLSLISYFFTDFVAITVIFCVCGMVSGK